MNCLLCNRQATFNLSHDHVICKSLPCSLYETPVPVAIYSHAHYTYGVIVETIYNRLFGFLPPMPVVWRRRLARWITDKLVPNRVPIDSSGLIKPQAAQSFEDGERELTDGYL